MTLTEIMKDRWWFITGWRTTKNPFALDWSVCHAKTGKCISGRSSIEEYHNFTARWDEQIDYPPQNMYFIWFK